MESAPSPFSPLPDAPREPSRWVRALRVLTSPKTLLQATGLLTLIAVAAGAAWILPPSNATGELPADDTLGTVAKRSIKAIHDYDIPDPEATEARRSAASESVRPVYDFDTSEAEDAQTRISTAFAAAREAQKDSLVQQTAVRKPKGKHDVEASPSDEALISAGESFRSEFMRDVQAVVDPLVYGELARLRFSEALERATTVLVRGLLAAEIAPSRELLIAEKTTGITIRRLVGGLVRGESDVRDIDHIPDVAAVRSELTRFAQGALELPASTVGLGRIVLALDLDTVTRRAAALLAERLVLPNLAYNDRVTQERRLAASVAVKPVVLQYARGEKIIGDGERIEKRHLLVFQFIRDEARALDTVQVRLGAMLFTVLLVLSVFGLARRTVRRFRPGKRDLVFLAATLLGNLALIRAVLALADLLRDHYHAVSNDVAVMLLPLAAGTMLVRMLRSGESSVVFALIFSPLAALHLASHAPAAVGLVASVVAADRLGRRTGRSALPLAALASGLAAALMVLALSLFGGRLLPETALQAAAAFIGAGVLSPLAAVLVAPLFELLFGYTSEGQLARLANLNHPVLKELIIKAPGTYHHSVIVGALAEAAAERVGAHPLLSRVGGYYHDLGKADAPLMFGENQKLENRLEKISPEEAAAILRKHVSDGLARAHEARLPRIVLDFIGQHHGNAHCGAFLDRAREAATRDGRPPPDPALFHYVGPKPRSREVALVMLADAVEAASRSVENPAPERLRAVVPKVVEQFMLAGQLDECDLTLSDLRLASAAFAETIVDLRGLSTVEILPRVRQPSASSAAASSSQDDPDVRVAR
jgi:putative nucleotidyltransferase with HDIG domain